MATATKSLLSILEKKADSSGGFRLRHHLYCRRTSQAIPPADTTLTVKEGVVSHPRRTAASATAA